MKSRSLRVCALVFLVVSGTACSQYGVQGATTQSKAQEPAATGGVDGGGGRGSVCRDATGAITSAESLDLYEGQAMYGVNIQRSMTPMADQLETALAKIPANPGNLVRAYVSKVLANMKFTPAGTVLVPVDDSFEVVLPKGCAAEQLARYYNDQLVLVNVDIWNALSETDRTALVLHEAIYAVNRAAGATNSRQSRHIVSQLFDSATAWTDIQEGVPKGALVCITPDAAPTGFWAFQDSSGMWRLQFNIVGRGFVFSKKTAIIVGTDFDFNDAKTFPVLRGEDKIGSSVRQTGTLRSDFEDGDTIVLTKKWEAPKDAQGQTIRGAQILRYYLSWLSGSYPNSSLQDLPLNCSVRIN